MADHCIVAGGTGTQSGADWSNALSDVPTSPIRGDTYYVATGVYDTVITIDTAESSTTRINILKASPSAHGVETGWSAAYGVGQAVFQGCWLKTGYITIDGVYGGFDQVSLSTFLDASSYGFSFVRDWLSGVQTYVVNFYDGPVVTNCEFKRINLQFETNALGQPYGGGGIVHADGSVGSEYSSMLFQRCYLHVQYGTLFKLNDCSTWTIEYCGLDDQKSDAAGWHGAPNSNRQVFGMTMRWNLFINYSGSQYLGGSGLVGFYCDGTAATLVVTGSVDDFKIYGNIVYAYVSSQMPQGGYGFGGSNADSMPGSSSNYPAQGGTTNTIQLNTACSSTDGVLSNKFIKITSGTGSGQIRWIPSYVGATRTATVSKVWDTIPDNTSYYDIKTPAKNVLCYNNTIANVKHPSTSNVGPMRLKYNYDDNEVVYAYGCECKNNLTVECTYVGVQGCVSAYNQFCSVTFVTWGDGQHITGTGDIGTPAAADSSTLADIFVDHANLDFRTNSNTTAGADLGASYNVDMFGNARTTWTRGAVEYGGSPPAEPPSGGKLWLKG